MNRPRVYHISKQIDSGKWQVRLATGQKAIKLFDTQEQAIFYAKSLVKSQGGSIRVHSLKGKMRKEQSSLILLSIFGFVAGFLSPRFLSSIINS
jgi:hypothetical protein